MPQHFHSKNIKFYVPLNKKEILERVSPFSIMERYYGGKIELGVTYTSPFRKDRNPSFAFHSSRSGKYKYIDFATGESGDCFDFVMKLYNCRFKDSLKLINQDFNLGLGNEIKISLERKLEAPVYIKEKPIVQIDVQSYTEQDTKYWAQFGITIETLKKFRVYSASKYWINKKLIGLYRNNDPVYAYFFPKTKHLKIYRPLTKNKRNKWVGNTDRDDIQGLDQLEYKSDSIILTSSLKDVMVLYTLGLEAIALNSEGARPTPHLLEVLCKYKYRYVLYDNDEAGIKYARALLEQVEGLKMLEVLDDKSKDPSDFVSIYGIEKLDRMLKSQYD